MLQRSALVLALFLALTAGSLTSPLTSQQYDFNACAQYSEARNGHAVLVMQDGKVLFERYANGWSASRAHRLASGTKSFTGCLLAIAVHDGLLGFDDKVSATLTEWQSDTNKSRITYRQLVGLISGLDGGTIGVTPTYAGAVATRTIAAPGQKFDYGPNPFQAFGEALKRILAARTPKETVTAYLTRRLISPLGMQVAFWANANQGEPRLPNGAYLTAREWAKFGDMIARDGIAGTTRIVAARHLRQLFVGTSVARTYGVGWWLPANSSALPSDIRMAKGAGMQRLYVLPARQLVVVRFGETTGAFSDIDFLSALMPTRTKEFGSGCKGSAGTPRLLAHSTLRPVYGKTFSFGLINIPNQAQGIFFLGASNRQYGAISLPFDLSPIGMTSCSLLVSLDLAIPFVAQNGQARLSLALPRNNSLPGTLGYFQALVFDRTANSGGGTVSNGLLVRVGLR